MWKNIQYLFSKKPKRRTHHRLGSSFFLENETKTIFQKRKQTYFFQKKMFSHLNISKKNRVLLLLGLPLLLCISGIGLLLSPLFQVTHIFISRQDTIINIDQAYTSIDYIRGKNIFLLDTEEVTTRLQKGQNSIQNLEFHIKLPHTLSLTLKSYPPLFQTEKYLILSNGSLLQKENIGVYDVPYLILITDNPDTFLFGNNLNVEELKNISILQESLKKNIPGFISSFSQYFIREKELLLSNSQGSIFIFDLKGDIEKQVAQLSIFQKEHTDLLAKKYIYIDVRIEQKLFLCSYEEEYRCRKNLINIYGPDVFTNLEKASSLSPPVINLEGHLQNIDDQPSSK